MPHEIRPIHKVATVRCRLRRPIDAANSGVADHRVDASGILGLEPLGTADDGGQVSQVERNNAGRRIDALLTNPLDGTLGLGLRAACEHHMIRVRLTRKAQRGLQADTRVGSGDDDDSAHVEYSYS